MTDSVVEIVYLPLKAGTDVENGDGKSVWQDTVKTVGSQPGVKSLFWGLQIENKDTLQMLVGKARPVFALFRNSSLFLRPTVYTNDAVAYTDRRMGED